MCENKNRSELDHLYLQDCIIDNFEWAGKNLTLYFESVDVLSTHPDNPFDVAKCGEGASLIFKNCIATNVIRHDSDKPKNADIIKMNLEDLVLDFEILEVKYQSTMDGKPVYKFHGQCSYELNSDFGEFTLCFESVRAQWTELEADSWFVMLDQDESL